MSIVVEEVNHPLAQRKGIKLFMARADLLHPLASGNKFYKLKPNIEAAKEQGFKQLLSFGGAFSNHIHAFALTAQANGFESIGIIRGEPEYASNPTLQDVQVAGMQLEFVNREEYKRRNETSYLSILQKKYPDALIIPEGGSSQLAIQGCTQLANEINAVRSSDVIAVACGTGATFSGIICGLNKTQSAIGYLALKDESIPSKIASFLKAEGCQNKNYKIESADFGGFAKLNKEVLNFILEWLEHTGILLDPIYTSKMCMRLIQQIESDGFQSGTSITILHSGGLQGWRGMKSRVIQLAGKKAWTKIEDALRSSVAN